MEEYFPTPGETLEEVAEKVVQLVQDSQRPVTFTFNESEVEVTPGMTEGEVCNAWAIKSAVLFVRYWKRPVTYTFNDVQVEVTPEMTEDEVFRAVTSKMTEDEILSTWSVKQERV